MAKNIPPKLGHIILGQSRHTRQGSGRVRSGQEAGGNDDSTLERRGGVGRKYFTRASP